MGVGVGVGGVAELRHLQPVLQDCGGTHDKKRSALSTRHICASVPVPIPDISLMQSSQCPKVNTQLTSFTQTY
jgi:hypothetical protein